MRSKKALKNTITSLVLEVVTVISGFIIPRLILFHFGSDYNGITASITQFLSYIALFTAGLSGVTRASLYKPLEEKNSGEISAIIRATELFMRKIAILFSLGLFIFAIFYPLLFTSEFDWSFVFTLALILGISTFAKYYYGITYRILLAADQKKYIVTNIQIVTIVLDTILATILIKMGTSILVVKFIGAIILGLNPIILYLYVRKKYNIDHLAKPNTAAIKQRWDAFAHQIANFANSNTDLVILSFFTSIWEISVYATYYLIYNGVKQLITSIASGVDAAFGNMIARNEMEALNRNVSIFEFLIYSLSTIFFSCMGLLILTFVMLYTKGITDVDYYRPTFGYLLSIMGFFAAIRLPYQAVARAAGHFKQTRNGAIVEAVLNIGISLVFVKAYGIVGVTIGSLVAMVFRTVQYGYYISKSILYRNVFVIIKRCLISFINVAVIVFLAGYLPLQVVETYLDWIINGTIIFTLAVITTGLFSLVFYKEDMLGVIKLLKNVFRRSKTVQGGTG